MKRITSALLLEKGACIDQVVLFTYLGGDRIEFTETLCLEHASGFQWAWAAHHLLSPSAHLGYLEAVKAALDSHRGSYAFPADDCQTTYTSIHDDSLHQTRRWDAYLDAIQIAQFRFPRAENEFVMSMNRARASAFYRAWVSRANQDEDAD